MLFRIINVFIIAIVALYISITAFLYLYQSRFIYVPSREVLGTPKDIGLQYEDVTLKNSLGTKIDGWYVHTSAAVKRGTVLFCHGNAGNITFLLDTLKIFSNLGLDAFVFDYSGFGKSFGKPGEPLTYADSDAAWDYLTKVKKLEEKGIIVWGRSLGGPIAARLAAIHIPAVLILESTFTSMAAVSSDKYPYIPVRLLIRYKYDTLGFLSRVRCPTLIIHSPDDKLVHFEHGKTLFQRSTALHKGLLQIKGGHHDGYLTSGEMYTGGIKEFLDRYQNNRDCCNWDLLEF